ncbi:MAG: flagellar hook-associated protein FlgL, partial [Desulfohalobiaceae bacterium]
MRVAHNMLFDSYISQLNQSTSRLQELSEQAASQKKVNRPSDNPVGTARILNYRDSISAIQQFQDNISQGKSRLGLADDTLQQTQDMLGRSKELAVQAANSSLNREDREAIAQELQQIFDQVLAQANTKYEGQSIFAGHKVQEQAYTRGLAVSSNKTEETSQGQEMDQVVPYVKDVEGESRDPIRVEFLADADDDEAESAVIGEDEISYKYSTDGGQSFSAQTLEKDETELELGDVTLKMHKGFEVDFPDTEQSQEGTKLDLKPTAIYQGDTQNKPGAEVLNKTDILVEPKQGSFESEVQVKVTNDPEIGDGNEIEYQYSLDQGATWSETLYADNPNSLDPDTDPVSLHLPGGEVQLKDASEDGTGDLENLEFRLGGTQVQQMNTEELQTVAAGDFQDKVLVRVDNDPVVDLDDSDEEIQYSYSTDQGRSWSEGNTAENPT